MKRYLIIGAAALFAAGDVAATTLQRVEHSSGSTAVVPSTTSLQLADRSRRVVNREVCEDVEVVERRRERDGNAGGTVAGAVIGGLLGNQIGSGSGRKAATLAGAVAGGYAGNRIDRNHDGSKTRTHVERECYSVDEDRRYR